jgi:carbonic anhydrase
VLALLVVLFEEGASNPELARVIAAAPLHGVARKQPNGVNFDPAGLLPADLSVFRFEGSLTTPPGS